MRIVFAVLLAVLGLGSTIACSDDDGAGGAGGSGGTGNPGEFTIVIQDYTFIPDNLNVPPGAKVTVKNKDDTGHTATSQAVAGDFEPGSVAGISFDSGDLSPGKSGSFVIATSATVGTVVPYYCEAHDEEMVNPNPTVTIIAP